MGASVAIMLEQIIKGYYKSGPYICIYIRKYLICVIFCMYDSGFSCN